MRAVLVAVLALAPALAGCVGEPEPEAPAASVPQWWTLVVEVVGVAPARAPVAGAVVVATDAEGPVTEATTAANGSATLLLRPGTKPSLAVDAEGWMPATTTPVDLSGGAVGAIADGLACGLTIGFVCPGPRPEAGERHAVSVLLLPHVAHASAAVSVAAGVHTPDQWVWYTATLDLGVPADLAGFALAHVDATRTSMTWTNDGTTVADFELAVGCAELADGAVTQGNTGPAALAARGERRLEVDWRPSEAGRGPVGAGDVSPCGALLAGPRSGTMQTDVGVALDAAVAFAPRVQRATVLR